MTLIATLIVWAIIEAICAKNPGPLLILIVLYEIANLLTIFMG